MKLCIRTRCCCLSSVVITKRRSHPSSRSSFHWPSLGWLPNKKKCINWQKVMILPLDINDHDLSPFILSVISERTVTCNKKNVDI